MQVSDPDDIITDAAYLETQKYPAELENPIHKHSSSNVHFANVQVITLNSA